MTRGHAWRFLDMGRRLERAMTLITLIRATLCERTERESTLLEAVLDVADSGMTYRRRYLATMQVSPVVDLLLRGAQTPGELKQRTERWHSFRSLADVEPDDRSTTCARRWRSRPSAGGNR